jgi:hypothetical protein
LRPKRQEKQEQTNRTASWKIAKEYGITIDEDLEKVQTARMLSARSAGNGGGETKET